MPARRSTTPAVLSLWALAATVVVLQACGSNGEAPAVFSNTYGMDASAPPECKAGVQGCACTQSGQKVSCGEVVTKNGSYVTCSMGTSTCEGSAWGPCVGNTVVMKSLRSTSLGGGWRADNIPLTDGGACTDPCESQPELHHRDGRSG